MIAAGSASLGSLPALLDHWSGRQGERVIYSFRDPRGETAQTFCYEAFAARTRILADAFRAAGLAWGVRAVLTHPPGIELVAALVACMRIGVLATVAPVTAGISLAAPKLRNRIEAIVSDCGPTLALGVAGQQAEWPAMSGGSIGFLATDLIEGSAGGASAPFATTAHAIALLQYTSGSTSRPRGVAIAHSNIIANARALIDHVPIGATWLPQFHDMGLIGHYLFPIVLGGSCHGMAAADFLRRPESWLRMVTKHAATYAAAPPIAFEQLLRRAEAAAWAFEGVDLSSLRVLMAGAEPVPPDLLRRFEARFAGFGLREGVLVTAYGLAEATLAVTHGSARQKRFDAAGLLRGHAGPPGAGASVELCSAGPPLGNLRVTIACPITGREKPPGEIGEIQVDGDSVAPFYWHERAVGTRCGVLRTRDLGFMCAGELFVCGRLSEVINRRGEKFHPHDIELAAAGVLGEGRNCVAFADAEGRGTLLIETAPGAGRVPAASIAAFVATTTGLQLGRIVWAEPRSISRTTSGKIARAETRLRLERGALRLLADEALGEVAQTGETPIDWLRARVARDGSLARIPVAEAGIDSLRLVQLQLEIEDLAAGCGLTGEIAGLDGPALLSCDCGGLLDLAEALERNDGGSAGLRLRALVARGRRVREGEHAQMAADAAAPLAPRATRAPDDAAPASILLTGATGFLGPQLLAALLERTDLPITVVARGATDGEARARVFTALGSVAPRLVEGTARRVEVLCGDLEAPDIGLAPRRLATLRAEPLAIYHNAARVDYVQTYGVLRPANVLGTRALLDLALSGAGSHFHHISSTFIFGWTRQPVLHETDANSAMTGLDFGYSQSKWVAEQLVARARAAGLACTIYRPSLISVSRTLRGDRNDVAARLLAFMIRHEIAVDTPNQLSLVPVDTVADNLVALSLDPEAAGATYHLTADSYYSLTHLTRRIGADFGYRFRELSIGAFISELNRLALPEDPVFPLLDFFNRSAPHIGAMTLKRYDNSHYRAARDRLPNGVADPGLAVVAARLVGFLRVQGWLPEAGAAPASRFDGQRARV